MGAYSFSASEVRHARVLGETFRRTRMLRRALIHKLTGQEYVEMPPRQIMEMSAAELMAALKVVSDRQGLLVGAEHPVEMRADARARQAAHMFAGGYGYGSRSKVAKAFGRPMNSKIYGYLLSQDGKYIPDPRMGGIIRNGFEIAAEIGYTDAGRYMNLAGVNTPMGGMWSKDTARDFFRNPVYAGYIREYIERNKRGSSALYPAWQVQPLITLQIWIAANFRYVLSQRITFPKGFINASDRQTWSEIAVQRGKMVIWEAA